MTIRIGCPFPEDSIKEGSAIATTTTRKRAAATAGSKPKAASTAKSSAGKKPAGKTKSAAKAASKSKAPAKSTAPAKKKTVTSAVTKAAKAASKPKPAKKPIDPKKAEARRAAIPAAVIKLHKLILKSLDDDKAEDIVSIELTGKSSIADFLVVASGRSSRQVAAIAEHLVERITRETGKKVRAEGKAVGDWVLIDTGDIVVHIFRPEVRSFYNLEKMWGAAIPEPAAA